LDANALAAVLQSEDISVGDLLWGRVVEDESLVSDDQLDIPLAMSASAFDTVAEDFDGILNPWHRFEWRS